MFSKRIFYFRRAIFVALQVFLFTGLLFIAQNSWAKNNIKIGVLVDSAGGQQQKLISHLRKELSMLLGSKYNIVIPNSKVLSSDWSFNNSIKNYNRLAKDKSVDVIIAAGTITSSAVIQQKRHVKPVIAIGVVELQHLKLTKKNTSGIRNLTYILFNRSITNDLAEFYRLYPYKRVAIIASKDLLKKVVNKGEVASSISKLMNRNKTKLISIAANQSVADIINNLKDVDAVYLSYLGRLDGQEKVNLINQINKKNIPSFGSSIADIELGVLAAIAPKNLHKKLIRRLALNIEAILSGFKASALPVHLSFDDKLTINMATAKNINFSPAFDVLSGAVLMNEFSGAEGRILTLQQSIKSALDTNLALAIENDKVKSSQLNVELARSNNYPSLSFNATGTQIDNDRAAASLGKQAEITTSGTLKLKQLIYSEGQSGNIEIQEHLLSATKHSREQVRLDVVLEAAEGFFTVLKAKTARAIQQENVNITRKNLNSAKQREVAGFSGRSDVFFWESQLATATTNYLSAINQYKLSQIQLNQILNHQLDFKFTPQDISLRNGLYSSQIKQSIQQYIKTPAALNRFTAFLVTEALSNSPEVLQINESINAQKRRLTSSQRKQYLPDVSLAAETQRIFSRDGTGSNVAGVVPDNETWSASVNLSWSLYDGGAIGIDGKQALTEIMSLKDQRMQLQQSLELKVRSALLNLVTQSVNLKLSKRSANFATKSLALVQDSYNRGKASVAELSDAQKTSTIAKQNSLNAVYDYLLTVLKSERAVGKFSLLSNAEEQAAYLKRLEQYFIEPVRSEVN